MVKCVTLFLGTVAFIIFFRFQTMAIASPSTSLFSSPQLQADALISNQIMTSEFEKEDRVTYILPKPLTLSTSSLITYPGDLLRIPQTTPPINNANTISSSWDLLVDKDFEDNILSNLCIRIRENDRPASYWGSNDFRAFNGTQAAWPASLGDASVDPAVEQYPANLYNIIKCGPFDISQAQKIVINFAYWLEINDPDDHFSFGYTYDNTNYTWRRWSEVKAWSEYNLEINLVPRDGNIWFQWVFESDSDNDRAEGVWLDDIKIWRYNRPSKVCGNFDSGNKGIVISAFEEVGNLGTFPIIRPGRSEILESLLASRVNWVRLLFELKPGEGVLDVKAYDQIVDTLCANDIAVLAVLNHQTLVRQDFNNPNADIAYRNEFTRTAEMLATYFEGRISHWEIWNEQLRPVWERCVQVVDQKRAAEKCYGGKPK